MLTEVRSPLATDLATAPALTEVRSLTAVPAGEDQPSAVKRPDGALVAPPIDPGRRITL